MTRLCIPTCLKTGLRFSPYVTWIHMCSQLKISVIWSTDGMLVRLGRAHLTVTTSRVTTLFLARLIDRMKKGTGTSATMRWLWVTRAPVFSPCTCRVKSPLSKILRTVDKVLRRGVASSVTVRPWKRIKGICDRLRASLLLLCPRLVIGMT